MRRDLGTAAEIFLRRRLYRRLGFVRSSDYARERLGVSGRTLQVAAWVATRLDAVPAVSTAFDRSELSWAAARAIRGVASAEDEQQWLELARGHTVEALAGCSSRRNLHDHHIRFRSRGGLNTRDNRTAVCVAHHLHGLHDGTIHASGAAPTEIAWQLGVRSGAPPFASFVGDRRAT